MVSYRKFSKRTREMIEAEASVNEVHPDAVVTAIIENATEGDGIFATMLAGADLREIDQRVRGGRPC